MANRDVALSLAAAGIAVFPCQAFGEDVKKPYRGVYWRQASTTDAYRVEGWWSRWPEALPGVDLAKLGLVVIDCDAPKEEGEADGVAWFEAAAEEHGYRLDDAVITRTGSGGWHVFFRQPDDGDPLTNARGALPPKRECGIDIRGAGGYIIGPGAELPDGRRYSALGDMLDAPPLPDWLLDILRGRPGEMASEMPSGPVVGNFPTTAVPRAPAPVEGGSPFFRNVNDLALRKLNQWVPSIFGSKARYQSSTGAYRVSSRALGRKLQEDLSLAPGGIVDFGIADMGDGRQGKRTPIDIVMEYGGVGEALEAAFWLCDQLGADPASLGWDAGGDPALGAAAARALLEQADGTVVDAETGEIVSEAMPAAPRPQADIELPERLWRPPGLVGDIAEWTNMSSRRPMPALSLGAALTVVGTAAGRQIAGPTGLATHLYVIGLAPTASGKDHPLQVTGKLLRAAGMRQHVGPSEFTSMPAVIRFLQRSPLALCAMDEFGAFLSRLNSRNASSFEMAISKVLRTIWGTSFDAIMTPEWAGRQAEEISAPALSIFGVSTEEEFYSALRGADVNNGVLNRLLIVSSHRRAAAREPLVDPLVVPEDISEGLRAIYNLSGELAAAQRNDAGLQNIDPLRLAWSNDGAFDIYRRFSLDVEQRMDRDVLAAPLLGRTVDIGLRIAAVIAIGRHSGTVDADDMAFGRDLSLWSTERMLAGARDNMADTETQARSNRVRRIIREHGRISHRDLLRAIQNGLTSRELKDIIDNLAAAEEIEIERQTPPRGGPVTVWYRSLR